MEVYFDREQVAPEEEECMRLEDLPLGVLFRDRFDDADNLAVPRVYIKVLRDLGLKGAVISIFPEVSRMGSLCSDPDTKEWFYCYPVRGMVHLENTPEEIELCQPTEA